MVDARQGTLRHRFGHRIVWAMAKAHAGNVASNRPCVLVDLTAGNAVMRDLPRGERKWLGWGAASSQAPGFDIPGGSVVVGNGSISLVAREPLELGIESGLEPPLGSKQSTGLGQPRT